MKLIKILLLAWFNSTNPTGRKLGKLTDLKLIPSKAVELRKTIKDIFKCTLPFFVCLSI